MAPPISAAWWTSGDGALLRAQLGRQYFRFRPRLFPRDSSPRQHRHLATATLRGAARLAPSALRGWGWALYAAVLGAAALGIARVPADNRRWLVVAALFVAYNLALFLVLHVKSRYRVQLMPVLDLWAGATAAWAWSRWPQRPAVAWVAGAALAGLALFVAFGGR